MADKLAQFDSAQPLLQPQPVSSRAEGAEAFAKTLGQLAEDSEKQTVKLLDDQSNAGFVQAANQAETIKTNAQIDMIKHPDQAENISNRTASDLDALSQNAFVNKDDRLKLKTVANTDYNEIRLKSASVAYSQSQKDLSINFWDSYPVTQKAIQDALDSGNFDKAKILEESFHQSAINAAQIGAISPEQYASIRKSSFDLYSRTQDLLSISSNPELQTASNYHAASASPFNSATHDNVNYPVDGNTQWMAAHYNADRTMSGQFAALYNNTPINWGVVAQGTENEYNEFKMQMMGVHQIKGAVNSGMPFSQIDNRIKELQGRAKLTPMETGEVNYWKSFKNSLQNDDGYLKMMSQTSMGGRYTQDYNQTQVAIKNSVASTPQQKLDALRNNDNDYIGKMIALGQSQHVDPEFIRPIPAPVINAVKSAFAKNADVSDAIKSIAYIKPEYRAYIADSMPKDNQAVAVFISGATMGMADTNFQSQLLEANQERDYSGILKTGKDETRNADIWRSISSDSRIVNLNNYFSKLPGGTDIQNGFSKAAVNYVMYRAAKEGDININGKDQYMQDFVDNVSKGFNIANGNHYTFNAASMNLRPVDMDYVADYALSQAYRKIHEGRTEFEFRDYVDANPLHATNTPDGRIVIIDKQGHAARTLDGNEAFDQPYTSNMLDAAHVNAKATRDYMANYFGLTEDLKRTIRLHPGFPFVLPKDEKGRSTLNQLLNNEGG